MISRNFCETEFLQFPLTMWKSVPNCIVSCFHEIFSKKFQEFPCFSMHFKNETEIGLLALNQTQTASMQLTSLWKRGLRGLKTFWRNFYNSPWDGSFLTAVLSTVILEIHSSRISADRCFHEMVATLSGNFSNRTIPLACKEFR